MVIVSQPRAGSIPRPSNPGPAAMQNESARLTEDRLPFSMLCGTLSTSLRTIGLNPNELPPPSTLI